MRRSLIHVRIPTTEFREGHFETDVRFDELRDLLQRLTERCLRIDGSVSRTIARRVRRLQRSHRIECFAPSTVQHSVRRRGVLRLERLVHGGPANAELRQLTHRDHRRMPLQDAWHLRCQRNGAEWMLGLGLARQQIAIQPAVLGALHTGRGGLHVILRVEVRPRGIRRSTRMDDGEIAAAPERCKRCEARIEGEESIEVDGRLSTASGSCDGNTRPHAVVLGFAVGDDHAEPVDCSTLKDGNQPLVAARG